MKAGVPQKNWKSIVARSFGGDPAKQNQQQSAASGHEISAAQPCKLCMPAAAGFVPSFRPSPTETNHG
jgi:hypothetical protein